MPNPRSNSSKHEYDKPRLKEQIDEAMRSFLTRGNEVQRVPPLVIPEPSALMRGESVIPEETA